MKSPVVKRSIVVAGHKTSVSLEEAFWNGMKEISGERSMTLSELVGEIDTKRQQGNLSSAIRLFVLDYLRAAPRARLASQSSRRRGRRAVWQSPGRRQGKRPREGTADFLRCRGTPLREQDLRDVLV